MKNTHTFEATLNWEKRQQKAADTVKTSTKSHTVHIQGKPDLAVSAAKAFKGDSTLYNPEDLLLSSLVSCHMMSYLYVCAQHQIEIVSYTDQAKAILETYADGSGKIIEVILNPTVVVKDSATIDQAISLHKEANKLCFIANSCNFPVQHHAHCIAEN
jgi:organic hydroperoxide reductase OsmC/OhrA